MHVESRRVSDQPSIGNGIMDERKKAMNTHQLNEEMKGK